MLREPIFPSMLGGGVAVLHLGLKNTSKISIVFFFRSEALEMLVRLSSMLGGAIIVVEIMYLNTYAMSRI